MMKNDSLHKVSHALVLIGALNWGLVGAFKLDVVELVLGSWPGLVRVLYVLVGIAALVMLFAGCKDCKVKK